MMSSIDIRGCVRARADAEEVGDWCFCALLLSVQLCALLRPARDDGARGICANRTASDAHLFGDEPRAANVRSQAREDIEQRTRATRDAALQNYKLAGTNGARESVECAYDAARAAQARGDLFVHVVHGQQHRWCDGIGLDVG